MFDDCRLSPYLSTLITSLTIRIPTDFKYYVGTILYLTELYTIQGDHFRRDSLGLRKLCN